MTNVFASIMDGSKKADDGKTGFIGQRKRKAIASKASRYMAKRRPVTRWIPIRESQTDPCNEALEPGIEDIDYWSEFKLSEE